ncbi:MAG: hypothetical protein CMF22_10170 [Idiomarinaceae bacterium]|nr:hypothetical protein [Idiomarinaceae bacterium]MBG23807.1 hypothetical protein [Idiomarinaceae bacterium]|tara:strand:+ start:40428 stop:40706 length:279 start_codon:yes stop_codon:yes gene_type:complete
MAKGYTGIGNGRVSGFYTRCQACDIVLNAYYQGIGLCMECNREANRSKQQQIVDRDNAYVRDEMYRVYLGQPEEDIFDLDSVVKIDKDGGWW